MDNVVCRGHFMPIIQLESLICISNWWSSVAMADRMDFTYIKKIGYIKLCGKISTSRSCHFRSVGWKIELCNCFAIANTNRFLFAAEWAKRKIKNNLTWNETKKRPIWRMVDWLIPMSNRIVPNSSTTQLAGLFYDLYLINQNTIPSSLIWYGDTFLLNRFARFPWKQHHQH